MAEPAESRARSFIERYVIARAGTFRPGADGKEDAWSCTLEAKTAYRMIAEVSRSAEPDPFPVMTMPPGQQGQQASVNISQPSAQRSPTPEWNGRGD